MDAPAGPRGPGAWPHRLAARPDRCVLRATRQPGPGPEAVKAVLRAVAVAVADAHAHAHAHAHAGLVPVSAGAPRPEGPGTFAATVGELLDDL